MEAGDAHDSGGAMQNFVVIGKERWDGKDRKIMEIMGTENSIIERAQKIFGELSLQRVIVIDDEMKVVFKVERRCRCKNVQYEMNGKLVCVDCGIEFIREKEVALT